MTEAEFLRILLTLLAEQTECKWEYLTITDGRRVMVSVGNGDTFTIDVRKE